MKRKVIDLFSGVGGLSKGFSNAGFDVVLANEIDVSIANSYEQNHPNVKMLNEDITNLDIEKVFSEYKNIGVIVGGPPCQGFSQKGKRNIMDDPRNYLFKYFLNVVNVVKPKYFVLENVPNIITANDGHFKDEIYRWCKKIGYTLNSDVLNSADYGVPQNRRRAIIIGKLGEQQVKLPQRIENDVSIWEAISDLNFLKSGEGEDKSLYLYPPTTAYQKMMRGDMEILYNHKATNHSELAIKRMSLIPVNGTREDLPDEHRTKSIYSGTWSRMQKDEKSVTITTRFDTPSSGKFTHPLLNRAITVREAARLQSFPDDFIFYGNKGSQMKQVGNAVPPLLAEAIATEIKKDMEE